ncbi:MAG: AI-2E family transporter, partial [Pseudomonadota bacterium]
SVFRLLTPVFQLIPLPEKEKELVLHRFVEMNFATLISGLTVGLIQGILAGLTLGIAGISSIFMWSTLMVVLAFVPVVGISLVYIPACIYLYLKGKVAAAILAFVLCAIISFGCDNWLKVKLIGNRIKINSLFVFFSILGAISAFGMAGIFYGPLIAILFLTFVEIYHKNYALKS